MTWSNKETRAREFMEIKRELSEVVTGRMLDIGCGKGASMSLFSSKAESVGVDISKQELKQAGQYGQVILGSGERLPFGDKLFDLVNIEEVLHHTDEPASLISEAKRVLKDGGLLLLMETVEDDPFIRCLRNVHSHYGGYKIKSRFYSKDLTRYLRKFDLEIVEVGGRPGFPYSAIMFVLYNLLGELKSSRLFHKYISKILEIFEPRVARFRTFLPGYCNWVSKIYYLSNKKSANTIGKGQRILLINLVYPSKLLNVPLGLDFWQPY